MGRKIDLTGRRFGKLVVLEDAGRLCNSSRVWRCRCDCGNECEIPARHLLHSGTVSCGCLRRMKAKVNLAGDPKTKFGIVDGTNLSRLQSCRAQSNNRSGYRGVSWHTNPHGGGSWVAVIYYKKTRYRLGFYATPEEASKAYMEAKERLHYGFLDWYSEQYGDANGHMPNTTDDEK